MSAMLCVAVLWSAAAQAKPLSCREQLIPAATHSSSRSITARDLVGLRDFGSTDNGAGADPPFSVSPDRRLAALVLRRADIERDAYCYGVVVVPLRGGKPRLLDVGGERIPATSDIRGIPAIDSGLPDTPTPIWSRDGRWLIFLRRDRGLTQVWRVSVDGKTTTRLSRLPTDVLSVELSDTGAEVFVTTRPSLAAGSREIEKEGRSGFLYDQRFWALSEARPRPPLPLPERLVAIDLRSRKHRIVSEAKKRVASSKWKAPPGAALVAGSSVGSAWTIRDDLAHPYAPLSLHVRAGSTALSCPSDICGSRVVAFWWLKPDQLLFVRASAPENGGETELYRWRINEEKAPTKLFGTVDALIGCQPLGGRLLCAKETAVQARRLVSLDIESGKATTLFDPNPAFSASRLGSVQRLVWSDRDGNRSYGDLVLPPGHVIGQRHPLIVVQYQSQGFLRGGTGDEYPIHLLAQEGFAVLSFQRPRGIPERAQVSDLVQLQRLNIANWRERRIIASVLEAGVDAAIAQGSVDAHRVGLTGMSDGGTTTQFLLLNSTRFKAAAVSSCCDDPSGLFVVGPAYRDFFVSTGYPRPEADDRSFWEAMSFARNGDRMRTPLLIQEPDMEYRLSLEAVSALQLHGAPVELYVYPDERHVKFHPAHRLAVYERSVAWFDFWLQNRHPLDPARLPETRRWEEMRDRLTSAKS